MSVEALNNSHAERLTQLHQRSLTGLLRDLGPAATRAFYHGAVNSRSGIGFAHMQENTLDGFILGSAFPQKLRSDIVANHFFRTVAGITAGIVRRPGTLRHLLSSLLPGERGYDTQAAELIYMAVDQNQRSSGIGKQLVQRFNQQLIESAVKSYELSVDADNESAIRFYDRLGFTEVGRYREFGIERKRYRMELS